MPEAILGEWEVWCVRDHDTAECLSKDSDPSRVSYGRDGTLTVVKKESNDLRGTWELRGDEQAMTLDVYGKKYSQRYRARVQDGRLVLSNGRDHSEIHGRVGAKFVAADSPVTDGSPVVRKLRGLSYTLPLPAGYRLGGATKYDEMWMPVRGDGFTVTVKIGDTGGSPCTGGEGGGSRGDREMYVSLTSCIDGTALDARCLVEHTRGHLEKSEKAAALALCRPLKVR